MTARCTHNWAVRLTGLLVGISTLLTVLATRSLRAAETIVPTVATKPVVIVVVGAGGEEGFHEKFVIWANRWLDAAKKGDAEAISIGLDAATATNSLSELRVTLERETRATGSDLWLVLIGHGTFDGKQPKFNLAGADLSAADLATLLKPIQRRLAVINCASASGPFLRVLSATNRVVLVATKSGSEQNFARYGDFLSGAIADPEADLDKDGQTSLLEAHLSAAQRTADFYLSETRLATEHPLLDDNGDGLGTPADWFRGIRAVKKAKDGAEPDGLRAHQFCLVPNAAERALPPALRARRDGIELAIAQLRELKSSLAETEYYSQLEPLLLQLARLYQQAEKKP